jgi:rhodanese-related sulfurtransferase
MNFQSVPEVDAHELARAIEDGAYVLDVRETYEFAQGYVPSAVNIPMALVPVRSHEIPSEGRVYVICASGNRSWHASAYLRQFGIDAVSVAGGTYGWLATGRETVGGHEAARTVAR